MKNEPSEHPEPQQLEGSNPIPELSKLTIQEEETVPPRQTCDDSGDSAGELELEFNDSVIKKTRKGREGTKEKEDYNLYEKCESFLGNSSGGLFTPKSRGEDRGRIKNSPVLLQYSFLTHAMGMQLFRSREVNRAYYPLKGSRLTENSGSRPTLPRHYNFKSKSAEEFLANQRLWSRSLTRENRNLLNKEEYRAIITEISMARPQDAIEIISCPWEFTDGKNEEVKARALESTKFVPKIFGDASRQLLGEEHYCQRGGSTPRNAQKVAMMARFQIDRVEEKQDQELLNQTATQTVRLLAVEPRRNPASFILHQMALDLIGSQTTDDDARRVYDADSVFAMIPMTMSVGEGRRRGVTSTNATASEVARTVNKRLSNYMPCNFLYPGVSNAPDYLQKNFMLHEGELVRHWIKYQKAELQQELTKTEQALTRCGTEEEQKLLQDKKDLCSRHLQLCKRLTPEATEEPMVKMKEEEMIGLAGLINLNCKSKWYARSNVAEQNTTQTV